MGAPLGNQNAVRGKRWRDAIDRALARRAGVPDDGIARSPAMKALDEIADKFVAAAAEGPRYAKGDPWLGVVSLLGDRLDGRPRQEVELSGDTENPVEQKLTVEFINAGANPKGA